MEQERLFVLGPHEVCILNFGAFFPPPAPGHSLLDESAVISGSQVEEIELIFAIKLGKIDDFALQDLAMIGHQEVVVKLLVPLHLPQDMLTHLLIRTILGQKNLQFLLPHHFGRMRHQDLRQALAELV